MATLLAQMTAAGAETPRLSSAPVDRSLYRDGVVRRWNGTFGRWSAVCDEIARLDKRYCSLSSAVWNSEDQAIGRLDVSTDDAGHPAALLHMPLGLLLRANLEIGRLGQPAARGRGAAHKVAVVACGPRECDATWTLTGEDIAALHTAGLILRYRAVASARFPPATAAPLSGRDMEATVAADGFADAIEASLAATLPDITGSLRSTLPAAGR